MLSLALLSVSFFGCFISRDMVTHLCQADIMMTFFDIFRTAI